MPITRKFLDWKQPALVSAAEYLIARYATEAELDLSQVIAVTPGSRAARQLLELLVRRADELRLRLLPPRIETVGRLPELLFPPQRPYASDLVQQLVWVSVVQATEADRLAHLMPELPEQGDWSRWLEVGKLLWRLHRELAAETLDFGHVIEQVQDVSEAEQRRWRTLASLQERYLAQLDDLDLWDLQTARLVAIQKRECTTSRDIVLVAVADMNRAMREMLDQVAGRVTALVFAPKKHASRFDDYGCLLADRWTDARIALDDRALSFVEGPVEQAECVAAQVAEWARKYAAHEVIIGAPDERLVPYLERQLEDCGVALHHAAGRPVIQSAPYRLLAAITAYLQRRRYREFASLVRHPDCFAWLASWVPPPWLAHLDDFYSEYLPVDVGAWPQPSEDDARHEPHQRLERIARHIDRWLEPLRGKPRRLDRWAAAIAQVLAEVYDGRELDRDEPEDQAFLAACSAVREALQSLETPPAAVAPVVTAVEALRIALDQLRDVSSGGPPAPDAVEVLGWLDLPLDLAPAMIVTSLNEGFVPTAVNADLFLPNALRRRLQLVDNKRRYARDAYALEAVAHSRRAVRFVAGRRDAEGNPMVPSRLLFATDQETIVRRVLRLRDALPADEKALPSAAPQQLSLIWSTDECGAETLGASDDRSEFLVPAPRPLDKPVTVVSVTAFKTYLTCPYRFYLRHVLHLAPRHDDAEELDPAAFGSMLHRVLDRFGASSLIDVTDAELLSRFLEEQLNEEIRDRFGERRLPAVNLQLGQLRNRLRAFAVWQANWAAQGWRIRYREQDCLVAPEVFQLRGHAIQIRGRIDRVDFNEQTGAWAVLDYKSSETAKTPRAAHRKGERWLDLQLPLYRHLAQVLKVPETAALGYIRLPKDTSQVGEALADWTAAELADADETARAILEAVLDEKFWPPATSLRYERDDYHCICQDKVFARQLAELTGKEVAS